MVSYGTKMDESLDSVLEKCLSSCGALSPHDALTVALHACLLAEGYVCVAAGDEVGALYLRVLSALLVLHTFVEMLQNLSLVYKE